MVVEQEEPKFPVTGFQAEIPGQDQSEEMRLEENPSGQDEKLATPKDTDTPKATKMWDAVLFQMFSSKENIMHQIELNKSEDEKNEKSNEQTEVPSFAFRLPVLLFSPRFDAKKLREAASRPVSKISVVFEMGLIGRKDIRVIQLLRATLSEEMTENSCLNEEHLLSSQLLLLPILPLALLFLTSSPSLLPSPLQLFQLLFSLQLPVSNLLQFLTLLLLQALADPLQFSSLSATFPLHFFSILNAPLSGRDEGEVERLEHRTQISWVSSSKKVFGDTPCTSKEPKVLHTTLNHPPFDVARNWIITRVALRQTDRSKATMKLGHPAIGPPQAMPKTRQSKVGPQVHVDSVFGAQQSLQHGVSGHTHLLQGGLLHSNQIHHFDF
ncbi:hypothetical protein CCH79_00017649 [Gambusia affinis]|uniref:Uncharacterized protein n=1 Tax=Gambusia affinis TaxID=33528 RepID=A0A315W517_GAMAF|nr:hypothetical protein CCH79_00017649 [Gambusia affinis]